MRVLVCGGRDYKDGARLANVLNSFHFFYGFSTLIHGGAAGADDLSGTWARFHEIPVVVYKADWETYGRSAGHIRNTRMLVEGNPDLVVAFPGGKGTANMIKLAKEANIEVKIIHP